ncbi:uncharacterized protein LOC143017638 isoform X2 [Oratosquilla oratoria]|uniref:uncharacterized protein LOC143017638 isoform X2 n=1 Tax=Oratosquilla oratoria TaxID=337810 RepID=UPI003F76DCFD
MGDPYSELADEEETLVTHPHFALQLQRNLQLPVQLWTSFFFTHGGQDKAWAPHMVFKSCTDYISASVDQRQKGLSEICISHGLEGAVKPCH